MRMWMVDPQMMCDKHLRGEHIECHMFHGSIRKRISMKGYLQNDLFEPMALANRHLQLASEMEKRGDNHKSPLFISDRMFSYLSQEERSHRIDIKNSRSILLSRCEECAKRRKHHEEERQGLVFGK